MSNLVFTAMALAEAAWDPSIEAYRAMLVRFNHDKNAATRTSADVAAWATTTRAARVWMAQTDPCYPLCHHPTPEGWKNDPGGVTFDPKDGLEGCTAGSTNMTRPTPIPAAMARPARQAASSAARLVHCGRTLYILPA